MAIDRVNGAEFLTGPQKISKRRRKVFLKVLENNGGNVRGASEAAGYRTAVPLYQFRKEDKEFAAAWDAAMEAAGDVVEQEALRRGITGVLEPVFYKGKVVDYKRVYSDRLTELLLKGAKPDKYRETVRVDGNIRHTIGVAVIPAIAPTMEEWEKAAEDVHRSQDINRITVDGTAEVIDVKPIREVQRA